jgi:DNA polymerase
MKKLKDKWLACQECSLGKDVFPNKYPRRVLFKGNSNANVVFVGEGPGGFEIKDGIPFVGKAGKILDSLCEIAGIPAYDRLIINSFVCSPDGKVKPSDEVLIACNPRIWEFIELARPKIVIALGLYAMKAIIGIENVNRGMGFYINQGYEKQLKDGNAYTIIPEYHPAYYIYNGKEKAAAVERWKIIGEIYRQKID